MKITLLSFYNRFEEYATKYSLGIMRIAAYLKKQQDYDIQIIPVNSEEPISSDLIDHIATNGTDILGIPNYLWTKQIAQSISSALKQKNPSILRIIGGPETPFTDFSQWQNDEIFILGEGEKAWAEIAKRRETDPFFDAAQVNTLNCDNVFSKIHSEFDRKYIYNMPEISQGLPLFSDAVNKTKTDTSPECFAWYETSRGCLYNCGYCGHKTRKKLGYIDIDQIRQELNGIHDAGIQRLFIVDPILGGDAENGKEVLKLCHEIIPQTKLILYLRPELLDDEYIELLTKTNLEEARLGIQTLNPNVPRWIRSNNIDIIQNQLSKLFDKQINWRAELIAGLPGDNFKGLKDTVRDVINKFQPTVLAIYHLTAIKGTRLYKSVDGTEKDFWLKINDKSQAKEACSYSEQEFLQMAQYATALTVLYNLMKQHNTQKSITYEQLHKLFERYFALMDKEKLADFDSNYARTFWIQKFPELSNKQLTIIRHGISIGNKRKIIQGTSEDYGLSSEGKKQIKDICQTIPDVSGIITSPMKRTIESAQIIQSKLSVPLITDARLIEMDPGILSGHTHEECYRQYPEYYQIWIKRKDLDGIPKAETGRKLQARAVSFLMDYYHQDIFSDLLVTHAGFMRCLINTIAGRDRTTPVCIENGIPQTFYNPLQNLIIETRPRAMASEVYIVTTADDKYVVKMKKRHLQQQDYREQNLLQKLESQIDNVPQIINLSNSANGCTKVLNYLSGKHLYGQLSKLQEQALTQQVCKISRILEGLDTDGFPTVDLSQNLLSCFVKAQTPYVKQFASEIIEDTTSMNKLATSPVQLVHSDLNRDNILFEQKDNKWSAKIIDWEGIAVLPKDYQMASYLASTLLLEGESMENCMQIARQNNPFSDQKYMTFLMKIRIFEGLYFFAENKNIYTQSNFSVSQEILNKYYEASKKITLFEKSQNANDNYLSLNMLHDLKLSRNGK